MARALAAMLDLAPRSRQVLPHLAALERNLNHDGLMVLKRASTKALVRLGQEMATLQVPPDDQPLQRMLAALLDELDQRTRPKGNYRSTFLSSGKLEVSEPSHSDFMAASAPKDSKPT